MRDGSPDHVEVDLDDARPTPPPVAGWSRPLVALAVVIVLGSLVAGLVMRAGGPGGDDDDVTDVTSTVPDVSTVEVPTVAQMLGRMPEGPIDGKASWRLPVLAQPQSELADGQIVTAVGKGFVPGERVGVVMCTSDAGVEGVAACELGVDGDYRHVTYAYAGEDGSVIAEVVVRQFITTPFTGPVDCTSAPERCIVAIGAVGDYDRSGGTTIGFAGQPPFPVPSLVVDPPGPYEPGQTVAVRASSMLPGRDAQIRQCLDDGGCAVLYRGVVAADGTFGTDVAVHPVLRDAAGLDVVCEGRCVLRVGGIGLDGASAAPDPADVPLAFGMPGTVPGVPADPTDPAGTVITSVVEPVTTVPTSVVD